MFRDELKQPLRKKSLGQRLWAKRPSLLVCAYAITTAAFAGGSYWAMQQSLPFAGEPMVTVSIPAAEDIQTASTSPADTASADPGPAPDVAEAAAEAPAAAPEPDLALEQAPDEASANAAPQQMAVKSGDAIIVQPRQSLPPAPNAAVMEVTTWGQLPKIGKAGLTPARAYARLTPLSVIHSDAPKIAIVVGGLGLNKKLTERAIRDLPGEMTLAFAPYGEALQPQANQARAAGHEVFLQVPLEPIGYPAQNPGPKTLLGDASDAENIDALRWHMSRFAGYAGVVNYMGGRMLGMPKPLKPVLAELKARGLDFLEDGSLALSASEATAKQVNMPVVRAKTVIDADPSPEAIAAALALLEEEAKSSGLAVGTASGLEVTIDTLADWAKDAGSRGIILVPATAAFQGRLG
ncbi:MAG: divergent polysaccharide deacetylase family protein [Hyphomicrobiales bacterium]